jgi:hypothetical protein
MIQMDGDGHLKVQLAVPVVGQGLRDRLQYEFFYSHTKHLVNIMEGIFKPKRECRCLSFYSYSICMGFHFYRLHTHR